MYYTVSGIITPIVGRPVHRVREDLCTGQPPIDMMIEDLCTEQPPIGVMIPEAVQYYFDLLIMSTYARNM